MVIDLTIDLILAPALQQHFRVRPTLGLKSLRKSQIQTIAFYLGFTHGKNSWYDIFFREKEIDKYNSKNIMEQALVLEMKI